MPYTIGIQSDANVPPRQVHTILPCLIGKLVLLKAVGTRRTALCRAYRSSVQPRGHDILFCGESTARKLEMTGRDFEAELREVSAVRALFLEPNARNGLLGAGFAGITVVLAGVGFFWIPPNIMDYWALLLGITAALATLFGLLDVCRNALP